MTLASGLFQPRLAFALAALAGAALAHPAAAQTFDGRWSVRLVAASGDCRAGYALPITVDAGAIRFSAFGANANGTVRDNGRLSVTISRDDDVLTARGALKGRTGSGSWQSPTQGCTGTWTAARS